MFPGLTGVVLLLASGGRGLMNRKIIAQNFGLKKLLIGTWAVA
jgi:hypothetical protein